MTTDKPLGNHASFKNGELVFSRPHGSWSSSWDGFARKNQSRMLELGLEPKPRAKPAKPSLTVQQQQEFLESEMELQARLTEWRAENPDDTHSDEELLETFEDEDSPLDIDNLAQHVGRRHGQLVVKNGEIRVAGYSSEQPVQTWCIGRTGKFAFARVRDIGDDNEFKFEYRQPEAEWTPRSVRVTHYARFDTKADMEQFARNHLPYPQREKAEIRNIEMIVEEAVVMFAELHKDFVLGLHDTVFCPEG